MPGHAPGMIVLGVPWMGRRAASLSHRVQGGRATRTIQFVASQTGPTIGVIICAHKKTICSPQIYPKPSDSLMTMVEIPRGGSIARRLAAAATTCAPYRNRLLAVAVVSAIAIPQIVGAFDDGTGRIIVAQKEDPKKKAPPPAKAPPPPPKQAAPPPPKAPPPVQKQVQPPPKQLPPPPQKQVQPPPKQLPPPTAEAGPAAAKQLPPPTQKQSSAAAEAASAAGSRSNVTAADQSWLPPQQDPKHCHSRRPS